MNLVAGLGLTGQSIMRYLSITGEPMLAYDTRADWDTQALEAQYPDVLFACGTLPKAWDKWITRIILSPGIARTEPWVIALHERGIEVVGDIELFARAASQPIIAITGSNGKSTVTTLVGEFLTQAGYQVGVGGNIGCPALDLLMDEQEYDFYVLELSSFQLETTYSLHCAASVVLNISQDHMDRYPGLEAYIQAKTNIYSDTELAVVPNGYDAHFWLTPQTPKLHFGLESPELANDYGVLHDHNQAWLAKGNTPLVAIETMALSAPHHQLNALAAIALCDGLEIKPEVFTQVLSEFKGLPHRTQLVIRHQGIDWIDDSKGTNVGATFSAIESLGQQAQKAGGRLILLAGGVGKGADFSELAGALKSYAKALLVFGRDADLIQQMLVERIQPTVACYKYETLQHVIAQAKALAKPGDIVLLSPACASFDQFDNYQDRGQKFAQWVYQALEVKP